MRIGAPAVPYVEPLLGGLATEPGIVLDRAVPHVLRERLQGGELDAALLPTTDALRIDRGRVIPGWGVVFAGTTDTEWLLAHCELSHVQRLSANLDDAGVNDWALVILAEWFGVLPILSATSDADARVATGMPLNKSDTAFPRQYDLGTLWREHTGMPFVAMLWMARYGARLAELRRALNMAAQRGLGADMETRQAATYRIGSEAMDGLRQYLEMAKRHGFVESGRELRFC